MASTLKVPIRGDGLMPITLKPDSSMTVSDLKLMLRAEGVDVPLMKMGLFALDVEALGRGERGYDAAAPLDPDITLAEALRGHQGVFVKDMRECREKKQLVVAVVRPARHPAPSQFPLHSRLPLRSPAVCIQPSPRFALRRSCAHCRRPSCRW